MDKLIDELKNVFGPQRIRIDEPLDQFFPRKDAQAAVFLAVNDKDELQKIMRLIRVSGVHYAIIDLENEELDRGGFFEGVVIKNEAKKFDILARKGKIQSQKLITDYALVEAESGVPFNQLVRFTIDEGLGGLEYGIGTPGSIGRVFAKEKEIVEYLSTQNSIQSVTILTPENTVEEITFAELKPELLVLSVIFKLLGEDKKILWLKAQRAAEKRGVKEFSTL